MKLENFGAFLSRFLRQEIFLTGFFLSEFHCICLETEAVDAIREKMLDCYAAHTFLNLLPLLTPALRCS
jgi:hypothetical protein